MLHDLRYAARWLRRSPGFTAVAVLSLALGIGFNTALFSVLDAVLFRPLPVAAPDRLVDVFTSGGDGDTYASTSYPDLLDFQAQKSVFDGMLGFSPMFAALNLPDRSRLVLGEVVTGNYFQVLGIQAAVGRTLLPEDDRSDAERAVVISYRAWVRDHGSDPAVAGRTLRLRGQTYTIVGVAPRTFTGMVPMLAPELWLPTVHVAEVEPAGIQDAVPSPGGTSRLDRRGQRWLLVKGRLRDGATVDQARANLELLMTQLTAAHPLTNKDRKIAVVPTSEVRIHPDADRALVPAGIGLMVAVGLVLAIACANVASMLLARAAGRQREVSIRLALGAGRGRLIRQLLTESVLLSAFGAAAGLVLASWLTRLLTTIDLPIPIPVAFDIRIDGRVLGFMVAVSLLAGLVAGLAPAVKASRRSLVGALKGETLASDVGGRRWTLRDGLVAAQIATTVVLLVAAGLLTRSLAAAQGADTGFPTSGIAIVSTDVDMLRYDAARAGQFWDDAMARVEALPGVQSAAVASRVPFSLNFNQNTFFLPGHHAPGDRGATILSSRVSSSYFDALGVPILEGRSFHETDTPQTPGVVIVSESLAKQYWPGESPIGRRLHTRGPDGPAFEIVGVSADHKVQTIGESSKPFVHFAYSQQKNPYQVLMVRSQGPADRLLAQVQRELLAMEPNLAFLDNQTMDDQVSAMLYPARAAAWVVSVVGVVAMLLAAVGLYGVIAYSVARRTREIGIRMALGARPGSVLGLVLRQGLTVALTGLAIGSLLA
ncbi:MAG TPA: ABC transporter permease, partial [Methylomirabilota bacterium]|nr:ABC transporter permease [Methylomirabilota bacterium]